MPVTFRDACAFIEAWHRHNASPRGDVFRIGVADDDDRLVGVVMVGRPVSRMLQADGLTLEVTRTCTDGTRNVNSMLYGAAWRAARALGWRRLVTYTQAGESGGSLRAAGWRTVAELSPRRGWDVPSRPRDNGSYLSAARTLWERDDDSLDREVVTS